MKTFVKRLQTRASRKNIKVSLQQVRDAYQAVVSDLGNPTEEEMNLVLSQLESSSQEVGELVPIPEPAITEITEDSHPDVWEILQPPDNAIASDQLEREEQSLATGEQTLSEVHPKVEETQTDRVEPARALTTTGGFALPEEDKHSLIHRQASALNVELNTSEITTIAGPGLTQLRVAVSTDRTDYIVTNDLSQNSTDVVQQVCKIRWKIEEFHRELKQLTGIESCQCRKARIQRNHESFVLF
jgi:hypothetical protein